MEIGVTQYKKVNDPNVRYLLSLHVPILKLGLLHIFPGLTSLMPEFRLTFAEAEANYVNYFATLAKQRGQLPKVSVFVDEENSESTKVFLVLVNICMVGLSLDELHLFLTNDVVRKISNMNSAVEYQASVRIYSRFYENAIQDFFKAMEITGKFSLSVGSEVDNNFVYLWQEELSLFESRRPDSNWINVGMKFK